MKAPKEIKNWVSWLRSKYGKKNGGIPIILFDSPEMERKFGNDKKSPRHNKKQVNLDT